MMKARTISTVALAGAMSLGVAAVGASGAGAATRPRAASINANGTCTKGSASNLQVAREDTGQLSIDVGVDMARHLAKVPWHVKVVDNNVTIMNSNVLTASDGSFSLTRLISPRAGSNHVTFHATNLKTGEVCTISGTV